MPPIHLDDVTSSAAIDIFILLTISIGIVAEIRRNPPLLRRTQLSNGNRRVAMKR